MKRKADMALADTTACPGQHSSFSALEEKLIHKFIWGKLSGVDVQELAHSSSLDGVSSALVLRLAALGGCGTSPQHIHSQIVDMYAKNCRTLLLKTLWCQSRTRKTLIGRCRMLLAPYRSTNGSAICRCTSLWTTSASLERIADESFGTRCNGSWLSGQ